MYLTHETLQGQISGPSTSAILIVSGIYICPSYHYDHLGPCCHVVRCGLQSRDCARPQRVLACAVVLLLARDVPWRMIVILLARDVVWLASS
jgi:hypothetical protein